MACALRPLTTSATQSKALEETWEETTAQYYSHTVKLKAPKELTTQATFKPELFFCYVCNCFSYNTTP